HLPKLLSQFFSVEESVLAAVNLAEDAQANRDDEDLLTCGYSEIDQTVEKLVNCLAYVRARFPVGREANTIVHRVKKRKKSRDSFFRTINSFLVTTPYDPLPPNEPNFFQDASAQFETQQPQMSRSSSDTHSEEDETKKRELCITLQKHRADFSEKLEGAFGERFKEERAVIQDGFTYGQMVQSHKHGIPMGQYSSVYWDAIKRGIPFQTLQFMSPEAVAAYISDIDQTTIELPEVAQAEERSSELVVLYSNVPEHGEFSFETAVNPRNYEDSYYGFAAFGLSVEKVFDQLSKNAGDLSLRKLMQSDIAVFVRAKMHQQIEMPFDGYQALCQQHKEVQKVKDAFIRELVDDYSWAGDLDSLIALDTYETAFPLPVCKKQKEFLDRINEFKTTVLLPALLKERQLLLAFCLRQDVFEHYIQLFRKRENWYSSCFTNMPSSLFKAIAKLNQISVYYWKRNAKNAFHLDLVCVDDQKSPRMVHLLYDPNQKRLIPLVIKSRPAPVKAYVDDTYCVKDVEELQRLSESGDAKAQAVLGRFFIFGCKVECNYESAERWSSAAKEQNDSDGYVALGSFYLFGPNGQRDPERAVELFRQAAQMGNMQAVCYLGEAYLNGWGVETNYSTAIKKFELAAKHHVAEGLVNLAICYREGFGVPQDLGVARHLFEVVLRDYKPIPSNQAVSVARLHLADMYRKGEGEAENFESATEDQKVFELYKEAFKEDSLYAFAYFSLGRCYFDGCGTRKNYSLAYKYFETALEKGYLPAASFLGVMAYSGWGAPINYTNAFRWCELASYLPENQQALFYLGLMHLFGLGTEVDQEKAKKIFEDPFLEEYAGAIRRLAVMYTNTRDPRRNALFAKANGLPTYSPVIRPALAMNSEGDAVIFYEKCGAKPEDTKLLYKVGKMQNGTFIWGEEKVFGSGCKPSVAIDSSGKVVLMYTKHDDDKKIIIREGCLKEGSIDWSDWKDEHFGVQASVAIASTGDNSGAVKLFEVHKSERRDRLHFRIGNKKKDTYDWGDSSGLNGLDGINPSVGIFKKSDDFFVFVAYEDKETNKVHYFRGKINGSGVQWWSKTATFNNAVNPSVFVNDNGQVLLVFRDPSKYDELVYYTAESISVPISWSARCSYAIGYLPSAVLDSGGNLFGVCEREQMLCETRKNLVH
ncbi:MAG: tetratricopeptide repeat protein, partial [Pseudomonadota bacterium]